MNREEMRFEIFRLGVDAALLNGECSDAELIGLARLSEQAMKEFIAAGSEPHRDRTDDIPDHIKRMQFRCTTKDVEAASRQDSFEWVEQRICDLRNELAALEETASALYAGEGRFPHPESI